MSKLCKEATLTRTQIQSDSAKTPSLCEFLRQCYRYPQTQFEDLRRIEVSPIDRRGRELRRLGGGALIASQYRPGPVRSERKALNA